MVFNFFLLKIYSVYYLTLDKIKHSICYHPIIFIKIVNLITNNSQREKHLSLKHSYVSEYIYVLINHYFLYVS